MKLPSRVFSVIGICLSFLVPLVGQGQGTAREPNDYIVFFDVSTSMNLSAKTGKPLGARDLGRNSKSRLQEVKKTLRDLVSKWKTNNLSKEPSKVYFYEFGTKLRPSRPFTLDNAGFDDIDNYILSRKAKDEYTSILASLMNGLPEMEKKFTD